MEVKNKMNKDWYKSKTVWVAAIGAAIAIVNAMGIPIPEYVYMVLASTGLYGVRDAMKH